MQRTIKNIDYLKETEEIAGFAKALAHPTRVKILKFLAARCYCLTGDLVEELPLAQSTISQHLKELKIAGLIQGEVNLPKIKYCINKENWAKAKALFNQLFE